MGGKGVKIAIIVVALLAAGSILYFSSGEEKIPKDAGSQMITVICESCGEHYEDSLEHLATIEVRSAPTPPPEGEGGGRIRRAARVRISYTCEKCGQPTAVPALKCDIHNKYYPAETRDGERGKCPDCG
ncbi:MAG: hypothetical protein KF841_03770 [Phycisphaerae bacterium]|nr:hypothetical protein [Phycisphaerae bacterium]